MSSTQFTDTDRNRLDELKQTVRRSEPTTQAWARALIEIDAREYWKLDGEKSMHEWCLGNSPLAYNTILNAMKRLRREEGERLIAETTGEPIIRRTHHTKVIKEVEPTLINVQVESKNILPPVVSKKSKSKVTDNAGSDVPEPRVETWERRGEISRILQVLSDLKCEIAQKRGDEDALFMKIEQDVVNKMENVYNAIRKALPERVCGICNGWLETRGGVCESCKSTGFMTEAEYKLKVTEETRKVKERELEIKRARA